jgi:uncharacterized protein (TIGR02271 family)
MNTIVGLFEDRMQAQRARLALEAASIPAADIMLDEEAAPDAAESRQGLWESLKETFGFGEDRGYYEEGIRRGHALVSVRAEDARLGQVEDILSEHGALDIDERAQQWRDSGWKGPEPVQHATARGSSPAGEEGTMPVVEEELRVGKRGVRGGRVRVYREVTEAPVQETIRLRDETVRVERRPADRPATGEPGVFQNETIEMMESHEEPVVTKQARVVEEVDVRKDVQERDETIRDTVRRSDVRVEREGAAGAAGASGAMDDDTEFRQHWTTHYGSGSVPYEQYGPAYRFGAQFTSGANAESADWTQIEPEARRSWEARSQGTWDRMKDAVRYSWERARSRNGNTQRRAA